MPKSIKSLVDPSGEDGVDQTQADELKHLISRYPQLLDLAALRAEQARRGLRLQSPIVGYRDDPLGFVQDCINWPDGKSLAPYQADALALLVEKKRLAIKGPHGLGKTTFIALVVLWFSVTRDELGEDWKVITTAGTWRQVAKYLWPEIHKWVRRLRWDVIGRKPFLDRDELQTTRLHLKTGEAFGAASDRPEFLEGAHADSLLYVLDESKAIPDQTFDAVEGALSSPGEMFAISISTPGPPIGRFYEIQTKKPGFEDWHPISVTLEDAIAAGRIDRNWAKQRALQWGETSVVYRNRVLGEFAESAANSIIPLPWVEAAIDRWKEWKASVTTMPKTLVVGVDVGGDSESSDESTLALRAKNIVTELRIYQGEDSMKIAGRVKGILRASKICVAIVDVIGIGAGVVHRLREEFRKKKERIIPFNAGVKAEGLVDLSGELEFSNMRSAGWWHLREELDPANNSTVMLPDDDILLGDLTTPTYDVDGSGRIVVESKKSILKLLNRSTDRGDAVMQAFAYEICNPDLGPYTMWGGVEDEPEETDVVETVRKHGVWFPT